MAAIRRRRLGRTGLMVTELGLGAMDTPQSQEGNATLHRALDLGVNFVDTAREYAGSELLIGQVIQERGGKDFYVSTKTFERGGDGAQHAVDRSLGLLGVDRIDLYHLHDVSTLDAWTQVMREEVGALAGLKVARFRGLIDHIGISSHSLEVLRLAIDSGEFDGVMLEYSAFYGDAEPLIREARGRDVGVIAMRPLGGSGRLSALRKRISESPDQTRLTPATLLRYVLSNPAVSVAIAGARYQSRVSENVALALDYTGMSETEKQECEEEASRFFGDDRPHPAGSAG